MTQLDFPTFSRRLILTKDLDPVYVAVAGTPMQEPIRYRWLMAYLMFYHVGLASYLSEHEAEDFWQLAATAAKNDFPAPPGGRWPRASERRHFRGDFAVKVVEKLRNQYPDPEGFFETMSYHAPNVHAVRRHVEDHYGFGSWVSFKAADLLDRVLGHSVLFDLETAMYDTPVKGAHQVFLDEWGEHTEDTPEAIRHSYDVWRMATRGLMAPPFEDRLLDLQEFETCLCKYKSHVNGSYWVGKDIHECYEASEDWAPYSPIAARIFEEFSELKKGMEQ